jgi:hypothetical protein
VEEAAERRGGSIVCADEGSGPFESKAAFENRMRHPEHEEPKHRAAAENREPDGKDDGQSG